MQQVQREIGIALDKVKKVFTTSDNLVEIGKKMSELAETNEVLRSMSVQDLSKSLAEGYEYPKTRDESLKIFASWLATYNEHTPPETKNSSYRRGRSTVLEAVRAKTKELGLLEQESQFKKYIVLKEDYYRGGTLMLIGNRKYRVFTNATSDRQNEFVLSDITDLGLFLSTIVAEYEFVHE